MAKQQLASEGGVTTIKPPNTLQRRVSVAGNGKIDFDAVRRAEQALEKLSSQFDNWMTEELERLVAARQKYFASKKSQEATTDLFHVAHDIKGQAPTLGYPFVSNVAAGLCRLLEKVERDRIPDILVEQHVDSIRALVGEAGHDKTNKTANKLCRRLLDVTDEFIRHELSRGHPGQ